MRDLQSSRLKDHVHRLPTDGFSDLLCFPQRDAPRSRPLYVPVHTVCRGW